MSTVSPPRPILKRPPPPLDAPLLSATFKVEFSPHVHFPPSPALVTAILSPKPVLDEHDGAQIILQTSKFPADVPTATFDFGSSDSDSDDSANRTKSQSRPSIRFTKVPNSPIPRARSQQEIDKALSFLPCPLSPFPRSPKLKITRPSFLKSRTSPVEKNKTASLFNRRSQKSSTSRPPALVVPGLSPSSAPRFVPPGLWPHAPLSPVPESPMVTVECPSSDEASDVTTSTLRSAFWRSISVQKGSDDDDDDNDNDDNDERSPDSLTFVPPGLASPPPASPYPIFMFGTRADRTLWSPRLPRKAAAPGVVPDELSLSSPAIFSPGTMACAAENFELMMSPAPNDPVASFSSFGAALEYLEARRD